LLILGTHRDVDVDAAHPGWCTTSCTAPRPAEPRKPFASAAVPARPRCADWHTKKRDGVSRRRSRFSLRPVVPILCHRTFGCFHRARTRASMSLVFRVANAADTGLPDGSFDRVLITLALHEMPTELRLRLLGESPEFGTGRRLRMVRKVAPQNAPYSMPAQAS